MSCPNHNIGFSTGAEGFAAGTSSIPPPPPPHPRPRLLVMIIRAWRYAVSKWVLFLNTIPKSWFCLWNSNIQSNAEFHGTGLLFKFWSNGNIFKENGYMLNDFSCLVVSFQSSKIPTIHVASEQSRHSALKGLQHCTKAEKKLFSVIYFLTQGNEKATLCQIF